MHHGLEIPTIHQIESFNMLIGSHFDTAIKRDVYQSIRESIPHLEATMALNDGQLAAILMLERLPAGWVIIQNPPGTGKTYLSCEAIKPFLISQKKHPIPFCSTNNAGVGNSAQRAQVLIRLQNETRAAINIYNSFTHS